MISADCQLGGDRNTRERQRPYKVGSTPRIGLLEIAKPSRQQVAPPAQRLAGVSTVTPTVAMARPVRPTSLLLLLLLTSSARSGAESAIDSVAAPAAPHSDTAAPEDWQVFRSVGKVAAAQGDLEAPGVLEATIAARAYKGEIIYFIAEQSFFTVALNYILNLHSVGLAHWLMLAPTQEVCDIFNEALELVLPGEPSGCVWSNKHAEHEGWAHHGLKVSKYKKLQILKMHYPAVLLEAGVNVMLTDVDVAFPRSFYPDMKTGRLAGHQLICQGDGTICNLGLVYAQGVKRDGAVLWMFQETVRRILEGLNPQATVFSRSGKQVAPGPGSLLIWDQAIFGDAILSAVIGQESRKESHRNGPYLTDAEKAGVAKMGAGNETPIEASVPGAGPGTTESLVILRGHSFIFASFPQYLGYYDQPGFLEHQPALHCVGAQRGPAKKFCLAAYGFWNETVERTGLLEGGAVGGTLPSLRGDHVVRIAAEDVPTSKEAWRDAVTALFKVASLLSRRPLVPPVPCNSTGWEHMALVRTGSREAPICRFNQCAVPGCWHSCGAHTRHTASQEFRWEQVMTAGPEPWRPAGLACDMSIELGLQLDVNMAALHVAAHNGARVLCLRMPGGPPAVTLSHHEKEHHELLKSCPLAF
eukprot:jgi/Tetstr1/463365/TSEL_008287.t1